jgi:hypothetical protein
MLQQIIAFIVILFFVVRLFIQYRKKQLTRPEFSLWLSFWILALIAVVSLRLIDRFAANIGFSSSGIQILVIIAVITQFYFIFRLRVRMAKLERSISKIVETLAINQDNN